MASFLCECLSAWQSGSEWVQSCNSQALCQPYTALSPAPVLDFEALGITSASVSQVFAWGFGALLAFWLIGFTVGSLIRTLNLFR
jgi:hypothetical protein